MYLYVWYFKNFKWRFKKITLVQAYVRLLSFTGVFFTNWRQAKRLWLTFLQDEWSGLDPQSLRGVPAVSRPRILIQIWLTLAPKFFSLTHANSQSEAMMNLWNTGSELILHLCSFLTAMYDMWHACQEELASGLEWEEWGMVEGGTWARQWEILK